MKTLCLVAVIIVGIQSVCAEICLITPAYAAAPQTGQMPCHGGSLPTGKDQSDSKMDPCQERLGIESRTVFIPHPVMTSLVVGEAMRIMDSTQAFDFDRAPVFSETSPPTLRFVLRI